MKDNRQCSSKYSYVSNLKIILILTLLNFGILASTDLFAQGGIEVTPFIGWQFNSGVTTYNGEADIKNDVNYGVALDFNVPYNEGAQLELLWIMQKSRLDFREFDPTTGPGIKETLFDLYMHYFQIGGVYGLRNENIMPFGSVSLGAALFHPSNPVRNFNVRDEWRFSATLGLGAKVYMSDRVGLRLQGRLLMPFQWGSGGFFCGTGGCNIGVGTTTSILMADLTAGLIIAL